MGSLTSDSDSIPPRTPASDEEASASSYATVSSAPPKRRAGRTKFRETRHPVYKGVRQRNAGRWVCEVREPNKKSRIWLGTFPTAEMAARAHDVAAMALRGRSACLNFADSAWLHPVPESACPRDIQRAARKAAEAFRQPEPNDAAGIRGREEEEVESRTPTESVADTTPPQAVDCCYMDDDDSVLHSSDLGMQGYLTNVGMLSPPHTWGGSYGDGGVCDWDDEVETGTEVSLWSYSI